MNGFHKTNKDKSNLENFENGLSNLISPVEVHMKSFMIFQVN